MDDRERYRAAREATASGTTSGSVSGRAADDGVLRHLAVESHDVRDPGRAATAAAGGLPAAGPAAGEGTPRRRGVLRRVLAALTPGRAG